MPDGTLRIKNIDTPPVAAFGSTKHISNILTLPACFSNIYTKRLFRKILHGSQIVSSRQHADTEFEDYLLSLCVRPSDGDLRTQGFCEVVTRDQAISGRESPLDDLHS